MLKDAGIAAPAKSWDELVEHCQKLRRDKISDTPFLPNWNASPSGTMPQLMTDCFSEGAQVFDAKNQLIVDQEPGAARAMERWQKVDRKSTRLNSSHEWISYAVFCLKKKTRAKQ